MKDKVIIFDTTLRDGEQSPGASMSLDGKLKVANQLARLGVDVIEAGFPVSSPTQFDAVSLIAEQTQGPIIAGLARAVKKDIDVCVQSLKKAKKSRVHTFLATSDIHLEKKLEKTKNQALKMAVNAVKYAKGLIEDVEFSAEDASRTNQDFLLEIIEAVVDAGANVVNIPDTVGYTTPDEYGGLIRNIMRKVRNIDKTTISVHCHNDLGLGSANSLAAVVNGARQVECTINGIGERAGNTSLEEIVMVLKTRQDIYPFSTGVNTKEIHKTSKLISIVSGIPVQPNKAIVGINAFAHESGIHQDGVLKERTTYEIITPESVGFEKSRIVLGRHSGRHGFKARIKTLGIELKDSQFDKAYERFIKLADKKKEIFDEDLEIIVEDEITTTSETYILEYFNTVSGNKTIPTATVSLKKGKQVFQEAACGDGPVDAAYKAIDKITKLKAKLVDYSLQAVTGGKDAFGEVHVKIAVGNRTVVGMGASTDVIEASVKAYINAVNRLVVKRKKA